MNTNAEFDMSALDALNDTLTAAAAKVVAVRAAGLDRAARTVKTKAEATARGYTKGTGALAGSVTITGTKLTKLVGSPLREGFFLEYGSPSTGPPRPWLTAPARDAITDLLKELGVAAT